MICSLFHKVRAKFTAKTKLVSEQLHDGIVLTRKIEMLTIIWDLMVNLIKAKIKSASISSKLMCVS